MKCANPECNNQVEAGQSNRLYCTIECRKSFNKKKSIKNKGYCSSIECICHRCNRKFKKSLFWTGKGTPKYFCSSCNVVVNHVEDNYVWKIL